MLGLLNQLGLFGGNSSGSNFLNGTNREIQIQVWLWFGDYSKVFISFKKYDVVCVSLL